MSRLVAAFALGCLLLSCDWDRQTEALAEAYRAGKVLELENVPPASVVFDSGLSRFAPVRIRLVGYGEPESDLVTGERLVIVVEGALAIYLFLDAGDVILRSEVVGS